jgi:hypothetical protein
MTSTTFTERPADVDPLDATVLPRQRRASGATSRGIATPSPATSTHAAATPALDDTVRPRRRRDADERDADALLYLLLVALVWAAWEISRRGLVRSDDDTSYWIAVAGGSMMLALFAYPLRKYMRFMQGLGKVKSWFWLHLGLGIVGPWLILVHSGFHIGSLNAGVALVSMCTVVISGVVGRFIYVRVHRGLDGERTSLQSLRERAGFVENAARSRLHFAPKVEQRLLDFEQRELHARPSWVTPLRQVTLLPLQRWVTYVRCLIELREPLRQLALRHGWSAADQRRRARRARRLVDQYLNAVVRVAHYTAYERVFAMWHMAHLPFIYLLVLSAVVHVIAVHAY